MQILVFLLGLSLLITIHELGHFIVAKIFGVYCHEFSIGMGPAIFSIKKGETKYSLRWLPIGGYVSMAGEEVGTEEEPENNDTDESNEIKQIESDSKVINEEVIENSTISNENETGTNEIEEEKVDIPYERTINGIKPWKRFMVIGTGVFMNFVLAYLLFLISIVSIGIGDPAPYVEVNYDSKESEVYAFNEAGIPEGKMKIDGITNKIVYVYNDNEEVIIENTYNNETLDSFNKVNASINIPASIGEKISTFEKDIVTKLEDGIKTITFTSNEYKIIQKLVVISDGKEYYPSRNIEKIIFKLDTSNNTYTISDISMPMLGVRQSRKDASIGEYMLVAGELEVENGLAIFDALGKLFTKEGVNNVGGIIAMADASNTFLAEGFGYYMAFLGLISVNLGVMNLLPIPGLDGSQLLVIIAEGITRKKLPNKTKAIINFIGLIFLMGLMILITIKDVFTFIV